MANKVTWVTSEDDFSHSENKSPIITNTNLQYPTNEALHYKISILVLRNAGILQSSYSDFFIFGYPFRRGHVIKCYTQRMSWIFTHLSSISN